MRCWGARAVEEACAKLFVVAELLALVDRALVDVGAGALVRRVLMLEAARVHPVRERRRVELHARALPVHAGLTRRRRRRRALRPSGSNGRSVSLSLVLIRAVGLAQRRQDGRLVGGCELVAGADEVVEDRQRLVDDRGEGVVAGVVDVGEEHGAVDGAGLRHAAGRGAVIPLA